MKFDYGTWIAIGAVLFFYLRLIILQRQKVKQAQPSAPRAGAKKGNRANAQGAYPRAPVLAVNKTLAAAGAVLMIAGAAVAGLPALAAYAAYWWLPVTAGIVLMGLGFR